MLRTRHRALVTTAALTVALTSLGLAAPVSAASEHEAPIDALFDLAESGDFGGVGEVVCEAEREAIVAAFDFGAELGVDDQAVANALTFEVLERSYEMLSEEPDTAVVQVTGSLRMSVDEDRVDDMMRAMLESERGPDDPPVSDEDVAQMAGFMGSALNQTQSVDQEVTVVLEDGAWLVCGGLVDEPEPDPGFAASVSTDGLCALATPAELTAVGSLTYDSSSGFEVFCNYFTSDFDEFHSVGVNLQLNADAEDTAVWFEADQPVQVGEYAGLATAPGAMQSALFLQVGPDLLQLTMSLPETPPQGFDWLAHATAVAGLFVPQIDAFRLKLLGPPPDPTPEPTPEISLCEALTLDELNSLTDLGFDDASGDPYYCGYSSLDGEPGFHSVQLSLAQIDLDGYRAWLPEPVDGEIAGMPALITGVQVVVELPGADWTLAVSGWVDSNDEATDLTTEDLMVLVFRRLCEDHRSPRPDDT